MTPAAREWVDKAEADCAAAVLLRRSRKKHSRDIVCFHLQQCVEKYLKARLVEAGISFPRTHDLEKLLDLALPVEPQWGVLRPIVVAITDYSVEVRYPGRSATAPETARLPRDAMRIRDLIRLSLGL